MAEVPKQLADHTFAEGHGHREPTPERRCKHMSIRSRQQCRSWRMPIGGTARNPIYGEYCYYHSRKVQKRVVQSRVVPSLGVYRKYLSKTLQDRLDECTGDSPLLLSLYEELSIARTTLVDVVQYYDAIAGSDNEKITIDMKVTAGKILREGVKDIQGLVEAASKLETNSKDKVSMRVLAQFLELIIRAIWSACRDETGEANPELAKRIEKMIRTTVRFPEADGATDTSAVLSPAQAVAAMDASIGFQAKPEVP